MTPALGKTPALKFGLLDDGGYLLRISSRTRPLHTVSRGQRPSVSQRPAKGAHAWRAEPNGLKGHLSHRSRGQRPRSTIAESLYRVPSKGHYKLRLKGSEQFLRKFHCIFQLYKHAIAPAGAHCWPS